MKKLAWLISPLLMLAAAPPALAIDQALAVFAEVEGLAEARLAGVEAVDDLLEALDSGLVGSRGAVSHGDLLRSRARDLHRFLRRLCHRRSAG